MLTHKVYPILVILSIAGLVLQPAFSFAATSQADGVPSTLGDAFSLIGKIVKLIPNALIGPFQEAWQVWKQLMGWVIGLWDRFVWTRVETVFNNVVDKRKPIIEQELQKERQEIKQEFQQQAEKSKENFIERVKTFVKDKF